MKIRRISVAACVLLVVVGSARGVSAQQSPGIQQRFGVSGTVGLFRPTESSIVDVYGHGLLPVTVQGEVRLFPDFAAFVGFKSLRGDGHTVITGTPVIDEAYPTSLHVSSLRFGATIGAAVARRITLAGSIGAGINWFEEQWPEAGLTASGRTTGFVAQAEVRYALAGRWSGIGRVEYASIETGSGANAVTSPGLGGFDIGAGIRIAF